MDVSRIVPVPAGRARRTLLRVELLIEHDAPETEHLRHGAQTTDVGEHCLGPGGVVEPLSQRRSDILVIDQVEAEEGRHAESPGT